jgi:hypothetical protein
MNGWVQYTQKRIALLSALILIVLQIFGTHGLSLCVCTGRFVALASSCHDWDNKTGLTKIHLDSSDASSHETLSLNTDSDLCSDEKEGHCKDHLSLETSPLVSHRSSDEWAALAADWTALESVLTCLFKTVQPEKVVHPNAVFLNRKTATTGVAVAKTLVLRI